jgi:hypothetical protein
MLQRGDGVPHFDVSPLVGGRVHYTTIWQRQHLLLVILPATPADGEGSWVETLTAEAAQYKDVALVVTRDAIAGIHGPAVVVADRWGEVVYAAAAESVRELPRVEELVEWVEHVRSKCPECEGEAK